MSGETVSVVIPTYNRAHTLVGAVDSVLTQTHPDVEVLVADDGSSDGTRELVHERWGSDPRVRYLRQENAGVAAARNLGIRHVTGAYLALLDSDDAWFPWKLELQLACLVALPRAGMVWTDMSAYGPEGELLDPTYLRRMYSAWQAYPVNGLFPESRSLSDVAPRLAAEIGAARVYVGDIFSPMMTGNLVHTSTVLLRRAVLDRVGGFDESLGISGEDYDFHLRTCREGPVAFADLATIRYQRGRPDQLTRPEYSLHRGRAFLKTITKMVQLEPERIQLPPGRLDEVFGEAHEWIAGASLDCGDHATARVAYLRALRFSPRRLDLLLRFALALLPARLAVAVRQAYRTVKTRFLVRTALDPRG